MLVVTSMRVLMMKMCYTDCSFGRLTGGVTSVRTVDEKVRGGQTEVKVKGKQQSMTRPQS